jgi:hypothetical protein
VNDLENQPCEPALPALVPGGRVRVIEGPAPVRVPPLPSGGEARLEIRRHGNVIQAIDVTCTCGETIRIVCDYGPLPEAALDGEGKSS